MHLAALGATQRGEGRGGKGREGEGRGYIRQQECYDLVLYDRRTHLSFLLLSSSHFAHEVVLIPVQLRTELPQTGHVLVEGTLREGMGDTVLLLPPSTSLGSAVCGAPSHPAPAAGGVPSWRGHC